MKRYFLYLLGALLLCTACQQDELPIGTGYLSLEGVSRGEVKGVVLTRAVDADLTVVILQNGAEVAVYPAGSTATAGKIEMSAGDYTLRAYNAAWQQGTTTLPQFYGETTFTIKPDRTSYPRLVVPMINCGVRATFPDVFFTAFSSFAIAMSHPTVADQILTSADQTLYFPVGEITYHAMLTNIDGEIFTRQGVVEAAAGKVYNLQFNVE